MANPAVTNVDPWGRSLGETLRRWWWVPVLFAILGAVIGGMVGSGSPSTATALLRVQSTANNGDGLNQAQTTALTEMGTSEVFQAAAQQIGATEPQLRERTEIAAVPNSLTIEVAVTGASPEEAARDANAFAEAAATASSSRVTEELAALTQATGQVIAGSNLNNSIAEQNRLGTLGSELAAAQSRTLSESRQVSVIQPATVEAASTTSRSMLILLGAVGLGMVGIALALLFGGRRGRMRRLSEMRRLYPGLEFIPARDVPAVLSMEVPTPERVVVTGVRAPAAAIHEMVDPVAEGLRSVGRDAVVTQNVATYGASQSTRTATVAPVTVLETGLSTAIVKRVARDPDAVLMVLVRPGRTRFEWLDEYARQFGERTYIVVQN